MCVQSSFYYQQWIDTLEVRIGAEDKQYSCPLIQEMKDHRNPERIDFSVPRRAQCMEEASRRGILV